MPSGLHTVPALHSIHSVEPAWEYLPVGQGSGRASGVAQDQPAGHCRQSVSLVLPKPE